MKVGTLADAKTHLSSLLADVEAGEEVIITRWGRTVARLVASPTVSASFGWDALRAWVESEPAKAGPTVAELRQRDLL